MSLGLRCYRFSIVKCIVHNLCLQTQLFRRFCLQLCLQVQRTRSQLKFTPFPTLHILNNKCRFIVSKNAQKENYLPILGLVGKDEVGSSNLPSSSTKAPDFGCFSHFYDTIPAATEVSDRFGNALGTRSGVQISRSSERYFGYLAYVTTVLTSRGM